MRAVLRVAVRAIRARWRGWALLALLVAVGGGAVLAAAAGAWRTSSAYPRFLQASRASDVLVSPTGTGLGGYYRALARLPGVAAVAPAVGLNIQPAGRGRAGRSPRCPPMGSSGTGWTCPRCWPGGCHGRTGRARSPSTRTGPRRCTCTWAARSRWWPCPICRPGARPSAARTPRLTERVVGIVVTRSSVDPVTDIDKVPVILATPALWHRLGAAYMGFDGASVRLRPGTTAAGFGRQAQALARRFPGTGGQIFVADEGAQAATVQRAIRPEAISLALFALVLAVTTLLIVGQAAVRQLGAAAGGIPRWRRSG